jgi:hypothetical protein
VYHDALLSIEVWLVQCCCSFPLYRFTVLYCCQIDNLYIHFESSSNVILSWLHPHSCLLRLQMLPLTPV